MARFASKIARPYHDMNNASYSQTELAMRTFTAIIERDPESNLYIGYVPGFPGAHTQAESMEELQENLREVLIMLLEDGDPRQRYAGASQP